MSRGVLPKVTRRGLLASAVLAGTILPAPALRSFSFNIQRHIRTLRTRGVSFSRALTDVADYFNSVGGGELRIQDEHEPDSLGVMNLSCDLVVDFGSTGKLVLPPNAGYCAFQPVNGTYGTIDKVSNKLEIINPRIDTSRGRFGPGNTSSALSLRAWKFAHIENPQLVGGDNEDGPSWTFLHSDCGITCSACSEVLVSGGIIKNMADAAFYPNGWSGSDSRSTIFRAIGTRVERCYNIATCKRDLSLAEFIKLHCVENHGAIRSDFIASPKFIDTAHEIWIRESTFERNRTAPIVFKGSVTGGIESTKILDVGRTFDGSQELGVPKAIDIQGATGLKVNGLTARMQKWKSENGCVINSSNLRALQGGRNHFHKVVSEGFSRGVSEELEKWGSVAPSLYNEFHFAILPPAGVTGHFHPNSLMTYTIGLDPTCYTKKGASTTTGCQ